MEAQIYPLSIPLDAERTFFNQDFFAKSPNRLAELVKTSDNAAEVIRLVEVAAYRAGHHMELYLDGDKSHAIAYLVPDH